MLEGRERFLPHKQWHPLFVTAVKEALSDARPGQVHVEPEVALSSKPLDIDVLVVKKVGKTRLSHPMARFYRRYNVIEFKGPTDYLAANDYYKGIALAYLYKALKHKVLLDLDDFTLTFVSSARYPRGLFKMVRLRKDLRLEENSPVEGVHQICGEPFPVQVVVLKDLAEAQDVYMFSPFLAGTEPLRLDATRLLFQKRQDNPDNPYVQELVEFKIKNGLITKEEMEVLDQMAAQMNTAERARVREFLKSSLLGREMIDEGKIEGKIEGKQEIIQKYLLRRFNAELPEMQREIQQINDLEVLDKVLMDLLVSNSLEEARAILARGTNEFAGKG